MCIYLPVNLSTYQFMYRLTRDDMAWDDMISSHEMS